MNELIKYKNGALVLDVQVSPEEETIWLTQAQMATLFGVNSQAITRHIQNIYNQDELSEISTCSKMVQVQNKDVSYDIMVNESPFHNNEPCLYKHIIETRVRKKLED